MTVSLVIATLGRREELARLLESLETQTFRPFQVVIVDQNPPGYLDGVIAPHAATLDLAVVACEPKGVSSARNLGLERACGDLVAFPDDDCRYAPQTLERVAGLFAANPGMDGLVVAWGEEFSGDAAPAAMEPVSRTGAFRNAGALVQFYRREAIGDVRFDPTLGPGTGLPYGCGEDTDFLLRMLGNGARIHRVSELLVQHAAPDPGGRNLVPKTHAYARGRMRLLRKHGFPLWFRVANVLYPLGRLALEGPRAWRYRTAMFAGRLRAFWQ